MASSQNLSADGQDSPMTLSQMTLTTAEIAVENTSNGAEFKELPATPKPNSITTLAIQQTQSPSASLTSLIPTTNSAKSQKSTSVPSIQSTLTPFNSISRSSLAAQSLSPCPGAGLFSAKFAQLAAIAAGQKPRLAGSSIMQAPCFFHKRFDDAINIERVLEEVSEGDGYSHSRLMQTAISVREISKQLQRRAIKRAVKSVMIVTKARDNSLVSLTRDLAIWLLTTPRYGSDVGVNVYVDSKLKTSKRFDAQSIEAMDPRFSTMLDYWNPDMCWTRPDKFDLVLTLGGDGTVLYTAAVLFQRVAPPVLAFSLGSLGFLTNFDFNGYRSTLDSIMGDEGMRVNLRMRFTCTIFRANRMLPKANRNVIDTNEMIEGEKFEVLNELVIDRGPSPYVSNLELYGDDKLLTIVQADGCIFSTPTGSTAYSLSAGGPLTHPSIPGLVLTPICPHTLSFRPMVLHDSLCLKVCVPRKSRSTAWASFDGKHRVELQKGDLIQVEAGRYPFPTVVGPSGTGGEWFESVQRALRWNTRGATQKSFSKKSSKSGTSLKDISHELGMSGARLAAVDLHEDENEDDEDDEDDDETSTPAGEDGWDIDFDEVEVPPSDSGIGMSENSQNSMLPSPMISARSSIAG